MVSEPNTTEMAYSSPFPKEPQPWPQQQLRRIPGSCGQLSSTTHKGNFLPVTVDEPCWCISASAKALSTRPESEREKQTAEAGQVVVWLTTRQKQCARHKQALFNKLVLEQLGYHTVKAEDRCLPVKEKWFALKFLGWDNPNKIQCSNGMAWKRLCPVKGIWGGAETVVVKLMSFITAKNPTGPTLHRLFHTALLGFWNYHQLVDTSSMTT